MAGLTFVACSSTPDPANPVPPLCSGTMSFSLSFSPVMGWSISFLMMGTMSMAMTCPEVRSTAQGTELDRPFLEMGHMYRSAEAWPTVLVLALSTGVNLTVMRSLSFSCLPEIGHMTLSLGASVGTTFLVSGVRSGIQKHESLADRLMLAPSRILLCPRALPAALNTPFFTSLPSIVSNCRTSLASSCFCRFMGSTPHSVSSNLRTASDSSSFLRLTCESASLRCALWNLAVSSAMRFFSFRMYARIASRSYRIPCWVTTGSRQGWSVREHTS
mmetsp:Transcript_28773/g.56207  ORF Transcript_28773/g.56207 Transcript_28773/m.56207 type:complete len:273 (-) Transcript_28773:176-994(-)